MAAEGCNCGKKKKKNRNAIKQLIAAVLRSDLWV
jgi:hypothetical protein